MSSDTTPEEVEQALAVLAERIVAARLETPAVFFLELQKPLAGLLHTGTIFAQPLIGPLFGAERVKRLEVLFSERKNIERLIQLIEHFANAA